MSQSATLSSFIQIEEDSGRYFQNNDSAVLNYLDYFLLIRSNDQAIVGSLKWLSMKIIEKRTEDLRGRLMVLFEQGIQLTELQIKIYAS